MLEKIKTAIKRYGMLDNADEVTVALSGGADSMALLNAMLALGGCYGIKVKAAHLNHMIRGDEAERDEKFVREYCAERNIELICGHADVPSYARENKLSTELAARQLRYEFFKRISAGTVATAHTASDNLETVIFNLTRGTAINGLCGIPPKRDIFIRPLILCTRQDIEDYCDKNKIPYITDSTNLSDDYARNKIRHNVIPVLKEINPSVERAVSRTCLYLSEDRAYIDKTVESIFNQCLTDENKLSLKPFSGLPDAVAKRIVSEYLHGVAGCAEIGSEHISAVLRVCRTGGKVSLPNRITVCAENNELTVCEDGKKRQSADIRVQIAESVNDLFTNGEKINNLLLKNSLDCDKIVGRLVVRTREAGDRIRIANRGVTKTLKKLYNEYGIPVSERQTLPVIADDSGVVWIYNIGVSQRCAVTKDTKRVYKIDVEKQ